MELHIKNMVCPRCITAVEQTLDKLGISHSTVTLGTVHTDDEISEQQKANLDRILTEQGFELIDDRKSQIISQIKSVIIKQIHTHENLPKINWSHFLAEHLHLEYKYLSNLFSSVESITIEQYILKIKVEKIKELISYDNKSLSQIAHQLNYSSVAHLSSQFKKVTGMTPSQFRKLGEKPRISLDNL
jgi:AraC-like DNA-binding protein